jgi:hypothetical protein
MLNSTPSRALNRDNGRNSVLRAEDKATAEVALCSNNEGTSQVQLGKTRIRAKSKQAKKLKKQARVESESIAAAKAMVDAEAEANRRPQVETFQKANPECTTCGERFPMDNAVVDGCAYEPETCRVCLEAWIDSQLDNTIVEDGMRCPSTCDRLLSYSDLKDKISLDVYQK